ncbi:MAG TPA: NUDIX domain-containing protein [Symbiobacteriaceae bacterium]|nr:NUDIX domain-containing protein [Symbiobacteriaceae bacterium]
MQLRKIWFTFVQVAYDLFLKLNPRKLDARAVIQDAEGRVLLLRSRYADRLLLPGGGLDHREHLDEALRRECREELGVELLIQGLSGLYLRAGTAVYVAAFRCSLPEGAPLRLSHEHSEALWLEPTAVPALWAPIVADALAGGAGAAVKRLP